MCYPVIHIKFLNDVRDEVDEDVVCLGLVEKFALVNFLNIEVSIDWNFHYT